MQPDDEMITLCAELREACRRIGHPLGSKAHDGDRWIAATACDLASRWYRTTEYSPRPQVSA